MKYVLIIGDGMADNPVPELGGKTPLEAAEKPNIDRIAGQSMLGSVRTVPTNQPPGSDTAILSIFGCDPNRYFTGRSPLEAAGSGVVLKPGDISYRCNLVALEDRDCAFAQKRILSHNAGSIEGPEAAELVQFLMEDPEFREAADAIHLTIHPSETFRHITVQSGAKFEPVDETPPHNILNQVIGDYAYHANDTAKALWNLMRLGHEKLQNHPINQARRQQGHLPGNGIWFWAQGTAVALPDFAERYGKHGSVISAVPLVHGIGALVGLKPVSVPGATGETETNYEGKVQAAVDCLKNGDDFVCIHVEAPDEATHNGKLDEKLLSISYLDSRVLRPLLEQLDRIGEPYRILMLSDHKTLMATRTHDGDPVPFLIYDSKHPQAHGRPYTEQAGEAGPFIEPGTRLMELLFAAEE